MAETMQPRGPTKESAWAPLRVKALRALWLAQVGSAIGTDLRRSASRSARRNCAYPTCRWSASPPGQLLHQP